jgi:hypothetical protein
MTNTGLGRDELTVRNAAPADTSVQPASAPLDASGQPAPAAFESPAPTESAAPPTAGVPAQVAGWRGLVHRSLQLAHAARERYALFEQRNTRLVLVGRVTAYLALIGLLVYIGIDASRSVRLTQIRWLPLTGAGVLAVAWWTSLSCGWSALVDGRLRFRRIRDWCRTQPFRYLPGGIWAPVARATTVRGRLRDKVAAVGAENVVILCVSLAAGGIWLMIRNPLWTPLVVLAVLPLVLVRPLTGRTLLRSRNVLGASVCYAGGFLVYGLANLLCQLAISGVHDPTYPLYVAGASCIAWAIGLVVVFAPSGVGVREVVYLWMLAGLYPTGQLEAAALLSRLIMIFAEASVLATVSVPWGRLRRAAEPSRAAG